MSFGPNSINLQLRTPCRAMCLKKGHGPYYMYIVTRTTNYVICSEWSDNRIQFVEVKNKHEIMNLVYSFQFKVYLKGHIALAVCGNHLLLKKNQKIILVYSVTFRCTSKLECVRIKRYRVLNAV
jgi:hypothetical protein